MRNLDHHGCVRRCCVCCIVTLGGVTIPYRPAFATVVDGSDCRIYSLATRYNTARDQPTVIGDNNRMYKICTSSPKIVFVTVHLELRDPRPRIISHYVFTLIAFFALQATQGLQNGTSLPLLLLEILAHIFLGNKEAPSPASL